MDLRLLLPEGADFFIAGGFAACPALAIDIDIWCTCSDPESRRLELLEYLRLMGVDHTVEGADEGDLSYELGVVIVKVATIPTDAQPIHLLVTTGDVYDVLNGFDISTHQAALTSSGLVKGEGFTPITEPPVVLRDTPQTPARLQKIAARYGHVVNQ